MFVNNLRADILKFNQTKYIPNPIEPTPTPTPKPIEPTPTPKPIETTITVIPIEPIPKPIESVPIPIPKPIKEYRGNQHDLDVFNQQISLYEYRRMIHKSKLQSGMAPKIIDKYATIDDLQHKLDEKQYKKKWTKLDLFSKKNKLKEYLNTSIVNGIIQSHQLEYCYKKLEEMIIDKKITKQSEIDYNSEEGIINDIYILKTLIC